MPTVHGNYSKLILFSPVCPTEGLTRGKNRITLKSFGHSAMVSGVETQISIPWPIHSPEAWPKNAINSLVFI